MTPIDPIRSDHTTAPGHDPLPVRPLPRRRLLGLAGLGATALTVAACSDQDPLAKDDGSGSDGSDDGGTGGSDGGSGTDGSGGGGKIVVGSQQYYSNEIIAELFAQAIESTGTDVDRQYQIGQREVYLPELEDGKIDVIPEYIGNLLQYYDKDATTGEPEEVARALAGALPDGLGALDVAEATDQDSYNTTEDFAAKNSLSSLEDLSGLDEDLKIAANSEFETRPYGPKGLKKTYGADATVVPVQDSGGPLTVKALTDGDVQLADIYSSDPAIEKNAFVTLEDPEHMILPENVVPIVSDRVDDAARDAINEVIAALTTKELIALNTRSVDEEAKSTGIAKDWLKEKGLV
jgi:osmoprotectant transport system substrate-binding protein